MNYEKPYHKKKVRIALAMMKKFKVVQWLSNEPHFKSCTIYDSSRKVYLRLYVRKGIDGEVVGKYIACRIAFSIDHHPELKGKSIGKNDVLLYESVLKT